MEYTSRIRARAQGLRKGRELLDIASRDEIRQEMRRRVAAGEKPVVALSKPMIEAFGRKAAQDDRLRQLAGEVAAHIVVSEHRCVRASASRKIVGDAVFTSGQPFRLPADDERIPAASVSALVERAGDLLVIGVPLAVAGAVGLTEGDRVEVEAVETTLVIRRTEALVEARRRAGAAVEAMIEDRRRYRLGDITVRELIEEGRR